MDLEFAQGKNPPQPSSAKRQWNRNFGSHRQVCATPLGVTSGRGAGCMWVIAALLDSRDETEFQSHYPTYTLRCLFEFGNGVLLALTRAESHGHGRQQCALAANALQGSTETKRGGTHRPLAVAGLHHRRFFVEILPSV